MYPVNKDYQLADFLKKEKLNYDDRKVKLFFEFTSTAETFYDSMEVIIMNTVSIINWLSKVHMQIRFVIEIVCNYSLSNYIITSL